MRRLNSKHAKKRLRKVIGHFYYTVKSRLQPYTRALVLILIFAIQLSLLTQQHETITQYLNKYHLIEFKLQAVLIAIIVSPYAFLIWYWRDQAKQQELKNAQANFVHTDFFKIQEWLVNRDSTSLQVAALYRLRDYLNGINGEQFMNPALQALMYAIKNEHQYRDNDEFTLLEKEFRTILGEEPEIFIKISHYGFFKHMNLSGISLENVVMRDADISHCVFHGVNFNNARLIKVNFAECDFSNATFKNCVLENCSLTLCKFNDTDFSVSLINSDVEGSITANTDLFVDKTSTIRGNVQVRGTLELIGRIIGDVYYNVFEMAIDAEVQGNLIHGKQHPAQTHNDDTNNS